MVDMATADGVRSWLAGFGDQPFDYKIADLAGSRSPVAYLSVLTT
jgi:hypothetical protein